MSTAYVNGRFVPFAAAGLPLDDPGVVWGAVITDRLRTFRGLPFQLESHVVRFRQSCELARVPLAATDGELIVAATDLVRRDYLGNDLSVVMLATPGPTLILHTSSIPVDRITRAWTDGISLVPVPATLGVDPRIKHRSRLPWWIATRKVQNAEPLFTDPTTGAILETTSANLLAVFDGVLTTPPWDSILPGVSLSTTLELAAEFPLPLNERPFTAADLGLASEVFLTNSTFCLLPVARVGSHNFPVAGPILSRLCSAWTRLVGVEIGPAASPAC
jgi:branched-chain amino acid aminotransferase